MKQELLNKCKPIAPVVQKQKEESNRNFKPQPKQNTFDSINLSNIKPIKPVVTGNRMAEQKEDPVIQFNLKGDAIGKFRSPKEAAEWVVKNVENIKKNSITSVKYLIKVATQYEKFKADGKRKGKIQKTAYGYQWKMYKDVI